jgi:sugar lactone lactonase YvrE
VAVQSAPQCFAASELLASDRANNRILAFDPVSGALLRTVSSSPLLDEPTGMTMGPGGFLYVSNSQTDVLKIDPATGDASVFVTGIAGPGGVAYDAARNTLFVSEFGQFDGDEIFQYDASGTLVNTIGTGTMPTSRSGLAFDAEGNLYASTFAIDGNFSGAVLKFDGGNNFAPLGIFASGSGLTGGAGIAFGADGNLYAASLLGQSVVKYTVSGGMVTGGAQFGPNVAYPSALLAMANGDLLVSSLGNDNPSDPIYGNFLFPGGIYRDNAAGVQTSFLVGDFTHDQSVAAGDLAAWQGALGTSAAGDANGDAVSDGADFLAWQRSVGNQGVAGSFQPTGFALYSPPMGGVTTIPEPQTAALIALAGLALLRAKRRPLDS